MKKNRDSNIEMLRIVSMFLIIAMHFLGNGKVLENCIYGSVSYYVFWSIRAICYISVNCFVLISGYYLSVKKFEISRIIRLVIQTMFYSIMIYFLMIINNIDSFSLSELLRNIFPISSGQYWFITSYILLLVLSPLLNAAMDKLSRRSHFSVCLLMFTVFCVIPTFLYWTREYLSTGRDLNWFLTLYVFAGYIRKYEINHKYKKSMWVFLLSMLAMIASFIVIGFVTQWIFGEVKEQDLLFRFNSVFAFASSVAIFIWTLNKRLDNNVLFQATKILSPYLLGAYLLHENPELRPVLWEMIQPYKYINSPLGCFKTICLLIFSCSAILVVGCFIERVWQSIYYYAKGKYLEVWIGKKINVVINKVCNIAEDCFTNS